MKKFVSLCAFVAALSFVSCTSNKAENKAEAAVDSLGAAVEMVTEEVEAAADQAAANVEATADSVVAELNQAVEAAEASL